MVTTIITTVGTSLIENDEIGTNGLTDKTFSQRDEKVLYYIKTDGRLSNLITSSKKCDITLSAEITSITKIQEQLQKPVIVHLVCTDTILSPLCAKYIKEWLLKPEHKTKWQITEVKFEWQYGNHIVEGLRLKSKSSGTEVTAFKETGIKNLIKALNSVEGDVCINITGGYKGVIPIMTMYAQIKKLPIMYTYEGSEEVIEINNENLPMSFDWEIAQNAVQFLDNTYLKGGIPNSKPSEEVVKQLKKLGLVTIGKKNRLEVSALGTMLKAFVEKNPVVGKGTLGLFMEYMLYRYFNEFDTEYHQPSKLDLNLFIHDSQLFTITELKTKFNFTSNNNDIKGIQKEIGKHNEDNHTNPIDTLGDIDLLLKSKKTSTISICEVKPVSLSGAAIDKMNYRIAGYEKVFITMPTPAEFIFIVYRLKYKQEQVKPFNSDNVLKTKLANFKNACLVGFRAYGVLVDLTDDSLQVNYTSLLKDQVITLEEIIL